MSSAAKPSPPLSYPWYIPIPEYLLRVATTYPDREAVCYLQHPISEAQTPTTSITWRQFLADVWSRVDYLLAVTELKPRALGQERVVVGLLTESNYDFLVDLVAMLALRWQTVHSGHWVIAWQRAALATTFAFLRRRADLDAYHSHIFGLFSAVDKSYHQRVIHYDRAIRKRVGSVWNLLLTDFEHFSTLPTQWIDSCGANVVSGPDGSQLAPAEVIGKPAFAETKGFAPPIPATVGTAMSVLPVAGSTPSTRIPGMRFGPHSRTTELDNSFVINVTKR